MITIASSLAKKVGNPAGTSRVCSNRRSREDKYGCCTSVTTIGRICTKAQPICNRGRLRNELLQLWGF